MQAAYWQRKEGSGGEAKVQELKPVIALAKQPRQEPVKPAIKEVGRVFRVCGQAYGLAEQIETLRALVGSKDATIQDKMEMLQMKEKSIELKNEEIGRLKREMAVLEPFAEGKMA